MTIHVWSVSSLFDGNDGRESLFVASLLPMMGRSLEQLYA